MKTKRRTQNETIPPAAASGADGNRAPFPSAFLEQIYDEALIRLAVITEEWQRARDGLGGG